MPMLTTFLMVCGMPQPGTGPQGGGEIPHAAEHVVHVGRDVLAVDAQIVFDGDAQRGVQHGAVLGGVDVFAVKHRRAAVFEAGGAGQSNELADAVVVHQVLRQVDVQPGRIEAESVGAVRVGIEKLAEGAAGKLVVVRLEVVPLGEVGELAGGGVHGGSQPF